MEKTHSDLGPLPQISERSLLLERAEREARNEFMHIFHSYDLTPEERIWILSVLMKEEASYALRSGRRKVKKADA